MWSLLRLSQPLKRTQGHQPLRRSIAPGGPSRGLSPPTSQAHEERQTRPDRLQAGSPRTEIASNALEPNADEVLIFPDELEIHLHPALAVQWAPIGQHPEVPAPGKNEKKVFYGRVK